MAKTENRIPAAILTLAPGSKDGCDERAQKVFATYTQEQVEKL